MSEVLGASRGFCRVCSPLDKRVCHLWLTLIRLMRVGPSTIMAVAGTFICSASEYRLWQNFTAHRSSELRTLFECFVSHPRNYQGFCCIDFYQYLTKPCCFYCGRSIPKNNFDTRYSSPFCTFALMKASSFEVDIMCSVAGTNLRSGRCRLPGR